jgi:hypothetical protein
MKAQWKTLLAAVALAAFFSLAGCEGDDGADGAVGPQGPPGEPGEPGEPAPVPSDLDAKVDMAKAESCATCHGGVGAAHTEIYDSYVDESTLELTIDSVTSVADGLGTYTVTVNFSITDNGLPLLDGPGLASMDQKRFYAVQYDSATGQYLNSKSLHEIKSGSFENVSAGAGDGEYILTKTGLTYAPETPVAPFDGAQVFTVTSPAVPCSSMRVGPDPKSRRALTCICTMTCPTQLRSSAPPLRLIRMLTNPPRMLKVVQPATARRT